MDAAPDPLPQPGDVSCMDESGPHRVFAASDGRVKPEQSSMPVRAFASLAP